MNHHNQQNKTNGPRTGPEFVKEMDFFIPVGAILVELKDCSDNSASKNATYDEADLKNYPVVAYVVGGRFPHGHGQHGNKGITGDEK